MTPILKTRLLAGAAVLALSCGGPALAFDSVDWTWESEVSSSVSTDVTVTVDVEASGLTQVENEQVSVGDLSATSTVTNIESDPAGGVAGFSPDDLGRIESAATSVGNNASIDSDTMTQVNSIQRVAGIDGAAASISADSAVSEISNLSVDSAATGVGNNLSVTLEAGGLGDNVLIANNVQDSFANISTSSTVSDVSATDFNGLGTMDAPLVGSAATSVGNNLSISASGPGAL